jgi:hypothetical protein
MWRIEEFLKLIGASALSGQVSDFEAVYGLSPKVKTMEIRPLVAHGATRFL